MLFKYKLLSNINVFTIAKNSTNYFNLFLSFIFLFKFKLNYNKNKFYNNNVFLTNKLFFKNRNFNKLFLNNIFLFLTPGIVLKYNNLYKKNLKNKTNMWNLTFMMISKLKTYVHIFLIKNFLSNLIKILRNLIKFNLLNSWVYVNLFRQNFIYKKHTIRRIKKWIKKKYFKVVV